MSHHYRSCSERQPQPQELQSNPIIRVHPDSQKSFDRLFDVNAVQTGIPFKLRQLPKSFFDPLYKANDSNDNNNNNNNNNGNGHYVTSQSGHSRSMSFDQRPKGRVHQGFHTRTSSTLAPMPVLASSNQSSHQSSSNEFTSFTNNSTSHSANGGWSSSGNSMEDLMATKCEISNGCGSESVVQQAPANITQHSQQILVPHDQQQQPPNNSNYHATIHNHQPAQSSMQQQQQQQPPPPSMQQQMNNHHHHHHHPHANHNHHHLHHYAPTVHHQQPTQSPLQQQQQQQQPMPAMQQQPIHHEQVPMHSNQSMHHHHHHHQQQQQQQPQQNHLARPAFYSGAHGDQTNDHTNHHCTNHHVAPVANNLHGRSMSFDQRQGPRTMNQNYHMRTHSTVLAPMSGVSSTNHSSHQSSHEFLNYTNQTIQSANDWSSSGYIGSTDDMTVSSGTPTAVVVPAAPPAGLTTTTNWVPGQSQQVHAQPVQHHTMQAHHQPHQMMLQPQQHHHHHHHQTIQQPPQQVFHM